MPDDRSIRVDEFVHARGAALARTAFLLTGDHHLAEDLVQAALVQAASHWERIHTSPEQRRGRVGEAPTARPESEWTYRFLVRDVPDAPSLGLAVDLLPDLDGTSAQQLTHDFGSESGDSAGRGALPYVLGGLQALLAGLAFIRMVHKQA